MPSNQVSRAAVHEQPLDGYLVSDDPARLQLDAIYAYLVQSYWSAQIPREVVERSVANSYCVAAYAPGGAQIGFSRFITDWATFCYVADVYVLEAHRGRGLAKAMMALAIAHPGLQGLRRWSLVTLDAHKLYEQFGFAPITYPERHMARHDPDVYRRAAGKI